MRFNKQIPMLIVVALLAFAAGSLDLYSLLEPAAQAQQEQEEMPVAQDMQAMIEAGTPGEYHQNLDALAGKWEAAWTLWMEPDAPPMESKGTVERSWIMDGRFILEELEAEMDFGTFKGLSILGYNNLEGRYESIWVDNMSTAIYQETGYFDSEHKTFKMRGSPRDPSTGRLLTTWGEFNVSDPDRHVYTSYMADPSGRAFKSMEGILVRKKG